MVSSTNRHGGNMGRHRKPEKAEHREDDTVKFSVRNLFVAKGYPPIQDGNYLFTHDHNRMHTTDKGDQNG